MEKIFNAEDLNKRTLDAQNKIKDGGESALKAHFELNKITEEAENLRDEAEKANAEFNKNNKVKLENIKTTEELVINTESKENSIENKTIGPIYMVYRDNRNWEKYAPKIVEHIKNELGGTIELKSFPRGTDEEEIEKWYEKNEDKFEGKLLLTDNTCEPTIGEDKYKEKFSLDSILKDSNEESVNKIFREAFGEKGLEELKFNSVADIENLNTKIFKLALEKNNPKKVTFVESKFGHHSSFLVNLRGLQDRSQENDSQVLELFNKCLINAGYPEDSISVVGNVREPDRSEVESLKNEWFFIDNHNPMADEYRSKGLNVINPSEIASIVKPNNDAEIENSIISGIDNEFKKITSVEEFISIYGSDPDLQGDDAFIGLIRKVDNEEKLIEIFNHLLDLNKNNSSWIKSRCRKISRMFIYKGTFQFSEKSKEQIDKKIEEITKS